MVDVHDAVLRGESLVFAESEFAHRLGPNATLVDCELVLRTAASALILTKAKLERCSIVAKKKLVNFRWCDAFVDTCTFRGTFVGNDFGRFPAYYDPEGGIRACDFRAAVLDGCRFMGCDPAEMKWPSWPCFTFVHPREHLKALTAAPWPGKIPLLLEIVAEHPPDVTAVTYHAPSVVKKFGGTEAEVRSILGSLPGVVL